MVEPIDKVMEGSIHRKLRGLLDQIKKGIKGKFCIGDWTLETGKFGEQGLC